MANWIAHNKSFNIIKSTSSTEVDGKIAMNNQHKIQLDVIKWHFKKFDGLPDVNISKSFWLPWNDENLIEFISIDLNQLDLNHVLLNNRREIITHEKLYKIIIS